MNQFLVIVDLPDKIFLCIQRLSFLFDINAIKGSSPIGPAIDPRQKCYFNARKLYA